MAKPVHIATRHVLFLPGFDPAPARTHRERYRREGAAQAQISGYSLSLSADPGADPAAWDVIGHWPEQTTRARIEVLTWSDLVRAAMTGGVASSYVQLVQTAAIYIRSGALFRLMRLRKGPVLAALFPVVALILQAVFAVLMGLVAASVAGALMARLTAPALASIVAAAVFCALCVMILRWCRHHDGRILAHYLMQDYAYTAQCQGAYPDALSARLAAFSKRVITVSDEVDEVLMVGHSSGAYLAVTVLADALRSGMINPKTRLSFLSLGQVVPMASFLPKADRLRADLAYLAAADRITWVDVTAPGDGCAFALCDPVAVTGVAPADKKWPLVLSAAFRQSLRPETWAALRWRFFRLHFQYLCAFDQPTGYDFFAITAGPLCLADRFEGRTPSASRIETPVNAHRSLAA
ncbi:MAG: hypothetical protein AAGF88_12300 [Pseudomonadota bacterium]